MKNLRKTPLLLILLLVGGLALATGTVGVAAPPIRVSPGDVTFETVRLQPVADTWLNAWAPTTNYGSQGSLAVRSGDIAASLLRFDLSALAYPQELAVPQATLYLYVQSQTNAQPMQVAACQVNRPWVAGQATWVTAGNDAPWGQPGANAVPADRAACGLNPLTIQQAGVWVSFDVTDMVRAWIADPSTNEGLILKSPSARSVGTLFASMEHSNPALRPVLEIMFAILPTPMPTHTPTMTLTPTATATPTHTPTPIPAVRIHKVGPQGPLMPESYYNITYHVLVSNPGTSAVHSVVVTDMLPLGTNYLGSTEGGLYDAVNNVVTWQIETLEGSEIRDLSLNLRLSTWVEEDGNVINLAMAGCAECPGTAESHWDIPVLLPTAVVPTSTPTPRIEKLYFVLMYGPS